MLFEKGYAHIPLLLQACPGGGSRGGGSKFRSPRTICVYVGWMDIKRHTSILRDRRRGRIGVRREKKDKIRTPKAVKTNKMTAAV